MKHKSDKEEKGQCDVKGGRLNIGNIKNTCFYHIASNTASGFIFGSAVGLFLSTSNLTNKRNCKDISKELLYGSLKTGKTFAIASFINTSNECIYEKLNINNNIVKSTISGCMTGALTNMGNDRRSIVQSSIIFGMFGGISEIINKK